MITLNNTTTIFLPFILTYQPWKTPFTFWIANWTVLHYLYMWYLLNEYYLCVHFEPRFYKLLIPNENKYFQKFWFEILKNDAHNGNWNQYPTIDHPRFGHKITVGSMIVKLNEKHDIQVEGMFHPPEVHWLTNPDDSLHVHMDPS